MVHSRSAFTLIVTFAVIFLPLTRAQDQPSNQTGSITGVVRNTTNAPISGATVRLLSKDGAVLSSVITDPNGRYVLSAAPGNYMLDAQKAGFATPRPTSLMLSTGESKHIDLRFGAESTPQANNANSAKPATTAQFAQPQFFDEPKFTVAGVTDASQYGGHGSDATRRNSESLAKSTAALTTTAGAADAASSEPASPKVTTASQDATEDGYLTDLNRGKQLVHERKYPEALFYLQEASKLTTPKASPRDQATLYELLGMVHEEVGQPLAAVREYQLGAKFDPSEANLFAWGAELLLHGAFDPAIEVFSKGSQHFPESMRMRLGLSVAWYARGSHDQAAQILCAASDLNPQEPAPYTFMGKMQSASTVPPACFTERLGRFASLQPQNATANYLYAVSLWKSRKSTDHDESCARSKALLQKSIRLDPKLAPAYLQLGIIEEEEKNTQEAIVAYKKSIELDPKADEPHYRLAQLYSRFGEKSKAQDELTLYRQLQSQQAGEAERQRRQMRQFVYTLRDSSAIAQP